MISMGHTDITMAMKDIHPIREEAGDRKTGDLEQARASGPGPGGRGRGWVEAWDPERRGRRLVSVVDDSEPRPHHGHSRRGREPTSVS